LDSSNLYPLGYFLHAVAVILDKLLWAYMWVVIIRALLSWVRPDPYNPIVRFINNLVDPVTYRISRIIPTRVGMMDLSPLILIVIIYFLQAFLVPVIDRTGMLFR
jgi:YggT family protein